MSSCCREDPDSCENVTHFFFLIVVGLILGCGIFFLVYHNSLKGWNKMTV